MKELESSSKGVSEVRNGVVWHGRLVDEGAAQSGVVRDVKFEGQVFHAVVDVVEQWMFSFMMMVSPPPGLPALSCLTILYPGGSLWDVGADVRVRQVSVRKSRSDERSCRRS